MDEFAENLPAPQLPAEVERYLARERQWWRLVRGTGAAGEQQAQVELRRWVEGPPERS
ncbi:hypothetical protein [Mycolicibacterium fortuitum]|uniref:hypothetical protein n=1 Tax=Mycolicibacterium fortuitum TaxID=1766 RepID=UPI00260AFD4E|nr:hypothetical protein [Mycolicibacterium fortuitum]